MKVTTAALAAAALALIASVKSDITGCSSACTPSTATLCKPVTTAIACAAQPSFTTGPYSDNGTTPQLVTFTSVFPETTSVMVWSSSNSSLYYNVMESGTTSWLNGLNPGETTSLLATTSSVYLNSVVSCGSNDLTHYTAWYTPSSCSMKETHTSTATVSHTVYATVDPAGYSPAGKDHLGTDGSTRETSTVTSTSTIHTTSTTTTMVTSSMQSSISSTTTFEPTPTNVSTTTVYMTTTITPVLGSQPEVMSSASISSSDGGKWPFHTPFQRTESFNATSSAPAAAEPSSSSAIEPTMLKRSECSGNSSAPNGGESLANCPAGLPLNGGLGAGLIPAGGCGQNGNFTIDFDGLPNFTPTHGDPFDIHQFPPVMRPYKHLTFSDGWVYASEAREPFTPRSSPNVGVLLSGSIKRTMTVPLGRISTGPYRALSAFWFDAFDGWFGCVTFGIGPCTFAIQGYVFDRNLGEELLAFAKNQTVPACEQARGCELRLIEFPPIFRGLSALQVKAYVGDMEQAFVMDDLHLGWADQSCEAGLKRLRHQ